MWARIRRSDTVWSSPGLATLGHRGQAGAGGHDLVASVARLPVGGNDLVAGRIHRHVHGIINVAILVEEDPPEPVLLHAGEVLDEAE
jgi:hypothetical protein